MRSWPKWSEFWGHSLSRDSQRLGGWGFRNISNEFQPDWLLLYLISPNFNNSFSYIRFLGCLFCQFCLILIASIRLAQEKNNKDIKWVILKLIWVTSVWAVSPFVQIIFLFFLIFCINHWENYKVFCKSQTLYHSLSKFHN